MNPKRICLVFLLTVPFMSAAFSQQQPLGQFEGQADIGPVKRVGAATYDATTEQ